MPPTQQTQTNKSVTGSDCPSKSKTYALEIMVVDEKQAAIKNIIIELRNSNNQSIKNKTDQNGMTRFDGLDNSDYEICLTTIDKNLWKTDKFEELSDDKKVSNGRSKWETSIAQEHKNRIHVAKSDDSVSSIAPMYGFEPKTIWDLPDNEDLKKLRKNMNILKEGDKIFIPERILKWEKVKTGNKYFIKKVPIQCYLNLQLLNSELNKSSNLEYLLSITTKSEAIIPDKKGKTDNNGYINEPIPSDTDIATLIIFENGYEDRHEFKLNGLDPSDTLHGKQQRLCNLGFYCDYEETLGESTKEAINLFQEKYKLKITGEFDNETVKKLEVICMC
jgi:hypothetical protein